MLTNEGSFLLKALLKQIALALFSLMPVKLARHSMSLLRSHPEITDLWGYHIRPVHYYEPLPDYATIKPEEFTRRRPSPAVDFNLSGQVAFVRRLGEQYRAELEEIARMPEPDGFNFQNGYFSGLDAALYYALLRDVKPKQVIEIGSGYSTLIADKALNRNRAEGQAVKLTCIEPYPQRYLTEAKLDIELIVQKVESLELEFFQRLQSGDVLFIDSSHAIRFGGDVCREFLEILPSLAAGVWVHVHDIFFPLNYPAEWVIERRIAWTEQYLLEAFLAHNSAFRVVVANYWLCLEQFMEAERLWPELRQEQGPHGRTSFWMQRNIG